MASKFKELVLSELSNGKITLNDDRKKFGLKPIDDPHFDRLLQRIEQPTSKRCPNGCDLAQIEPDDFFCGKCGYELNIGGDSVDEQRIREIIREELGVGTKATVMIDGKKVAEILDNSKNAIAEMKRVFEEHKNIETVIVNPDSWVGKELLNQTKRLIDLRRDVDHLTSSINRLETIRHISKVKEVREVTTAVEANELLNQGWVLYTTMQNTNNALYLLVRY